jgi:hypothetical protein
MDNPEIQAKMCEDHKNVPMAEVSYGLEVRLELGDLRGLVTARWKRALESEDASLRVLYTSSTSVMRQTFYRSFSRKVSILAAWSEFCFPRRLIS